jgi:hypothetical protein
MFKFKNAISVEFDTATDFEQLRRELFAALNYIELKDPALYDRLTRLRFFYSCIQKEK